MVAKASYNSELLNLFTRTAERGSIAAAARSMNLSPSLATRKIAQLESALGARLFERTTRSIKLTEAGAVALRWASSSLEAQAQVMDDITTLQGNPSGLIRMAVAQYAAAAYLPPLLAQFSEQYPQIRLSITTTDSLVNLVQDHYDVAIHSGRIPDSTVVGQRVSEFERVLCATPAYMARKGVPDSPRSLPQHDCLSHATNETRNWFFLRGRTLLAQAIEPRIEVDNYSVLLELARRSLGIARVAHNLVKKDLASGRLVRVLPGYKCVYPDGELPGLWVLYPNRRVLHRTRLLIDFLTTNLRGAR